MHRLARGSLGGSPRHGVAQPACTAPAMPVPSAKAPRQSAAEIFGDFEGQECPENAHAFGEQPV